MKFQWNFQERCDFILKSQKKRGFTLSLQDTFLEKPQGGGRGQIEPEAF